MRIAVFGTGGVGGYFGGRLAQAGAEVIFIARGEHLRAIQSSGLTVSDGAGNGFVIHPAQATDDPAQVGVVDMILVGVKTWQLAAAIKAMPPLLGPETFILPLLNGIEAPTELAAAVGAQRVLGGLCTLISYLVAPGEIRTLRAAGGLQFGELDNQRSTRVQQLEALFQRAENVNVEVPPNIQAAMWQKFCIIAPWSGLGAVTRAPIGVFRSQPETRELLRRAIQEVYDVARATQIDLAPNIVQQTIERLDKIAVEGTASMQRDIMAGRPSELEAQSGAVVRYGAAVGVATPVHQFIYATLLPLERRACGQVQWAPIE